MYSPLIAVLDTCISSLPLVSEEPKGYFYFLLCRDQGAYETTFV